MLCAAFCFLRGLTPRPLLSKFRPRATMKSSATPYLRSLLRAVAASAATALFAFLSWSAWTSGAGRLYSHSALLTGEVEAAVSAVNLSPADPEVRHALAVLLLESGDAAGAVREFERATDLRPDHYAYWSKLALARETAGDVEGAINAARRAVELAPHYARPRWELGNLLFRAGDAAAGFASMREAVRRDPSYLPGLRDLAWNAAGGDARLVESWVAPETPSEVAGLARFLVGRGESSVSAALLSRAAGVPEADGRALTSDLLTAGRFREAYVAWAAERKDIAVEPSGELLDGGFEGELSFDERGFGWQFTRSASGGPVRVSLDGEERKSGSHSLRVDFGGDSNQSAPPVSQLLIVEPGARYRLSFFARSGELVTGGLPLVRVYEARARGESKLLAESQTLPEGTSGWRDFVLEFTAPAGAEAVRISLERRGCPSGPCPAFGSLWLDDFTLVKL